MDSQSSSPWTMNIYMNFDELWTYHPAICYIAMERSTMLLRTVNIRKPSMGHLYHGYVSQLVITRWYIKIHSTPATHIVDRPETPCSTRVSMRFATPRSGASVDEHRIDGSGRCGIAGWVSDLLGSTWTDPFSKRNDARVHVRMRRYRRCEERIRWY